ncbi:MAG TPA: tetraacyldisaccharide 4'-kinase [Mucilaginibacter sp.]|nr:tetraacyldisaccharide 4'-kinase [Mucilaginibacter sp.]
MKYLRWLLLPFSLLYGLVVIVRNWLYDAGLFKSYSFKKPVIVVGNLEAGGAGKSPMTEYLIRLLQKQYQIATLSRGYGRKTRGFIKAGTTEAAGQAITPGLNLSATIGDEPAQFHRKFPDLTVAVCEDRVFGLKKLFPEHDLVLMDDAYQHRAVEPGLSILLFDYNRLNEPHFLLPAGNFREPFSGRWRAQVIVVAKCPVGIGLDEFNNIAERIRPLPYQALFFSAINYQPLHDLYGNQAKVVIDGDTTVFLLTGIANPKPLLRHVRRSTDRIIHHNYPDHHPFTLKNITKLVAEYNACPSEKKIIITTEKDAQRLEESWFGPVQHPDASFPVFVIPIRVGFLNDGGDNFNKIVTDYVREHTTNNSLH